MRDIEAPPLFLLDANACNALQQIEELNEIEYLGRKGSIELQYTKTTWDEARYGSLNRDIKVSTFVFTGLVGLSEYVSPWWDAIAQIVFPKGIKGENQRRDVDALLTAKLAGGVFVTRDGGSKSQPGGILGHKTELAGLGIEVLNFPNALQRAKAA